MLLVFFLLNIFLQVELSNSVELLTILSLIHPLFLTFIPLYSKAASMKKEDVQKIHFLERLDLKEMRS